MFNAILTALTRWEDRAQSWLSAHAPWSLHWDDISPHLTEAELMEELDYGRPSEPQWQPPPGTMFH